MLTDASDIQTISDALGAADTALQAVTNPATSGTAANKLKAARSLIHTDAAESDFDNALAWETSLRKVELALPATLLGLLTASCAATEAYYVAQTGNKTRVQFKTGVTWSTAFRDLWRKALREELIVRLWSLTNTSGTWGSPATDKAISLDTALEIHAYTNITAPITLNLVMLKAASTTELVTLTIPASTPAGTVFPVKSATSRYVGTQSVGVTGGEATDVLELWTV